MKKYVAVLLGMLAVYTAVIVYYFLHQDVNSTPLSLRGGPADPATFMTADQLEKIHRLSTIRYLSYFLSTPVEWGILLLLMLLGISAWFRNRAEAVFQASLLRLGLYLVFFQLAMTLIEFPLNYYLFHLNHSYGLSNQPFGSWLNDQGKSFGLNLAISLPLFGLYYWVMGKSPRRWWLWGWCLSIPLTLFFTFIQPVLLDPVFNDFKPLQDQQLKQEILQLAKQAHIPTDQVYQVDKSKQTNTLNAYVSGIGSSTRIVLWDTTLKKLSNDEILFIMAHEMGHYVKHHVLWGTLFGIAESFVGFWLIYRLYGYLQRRWGTALRIRGPLDPAAFPAVLLLMSILGFAAAPIDNLFSRTQEHSADVYAIQLRQDPQAGVKAFQQLAANSLSDVNPPALVQFFLGSHPTLAERIDFVEHYPISK